MDTQRRAFLTGNWARASANSAAQSPRRTNLQPLPWFISEKAQSVDCSSCRACLDACPTNIITIGPDGMAGVDFNKGECELCRACADICPADLFTPASKAPWQIRAEITETCLANNGVVCQTCHELCPNDAIRLSHRLGAPPSLTIETDACSGCGACIAPCPSAAIDMVSPADTDADAQTSSSEPISPPKKQQPTRAAYDFSSETIRV